MLWKLFKTYAKPYRWTMLWVIVLQTVAIGATLILPGLNARIIDDGITTGDIGFIWRTGGIMLGVAILQLIVMMTAVWFSARSSMGLGRDLRQDVFRRVSTMSTNQVHTFGPATLITRGTNDVQQVQMLVLMTLNFIVLAPIMGIGAMILALGEDPGLSWLVWVTIPIMGVFIGVMLWRLLPVFRQIQEAIDDVNEVLREQISGVRVIRAFVREGYEADRFHEANSHLVGLSLKVGRIFATFFPVISLLMHAATAAVLWFGGARVDEGLVNVGSLIAFMQYLLMILMAVMMGSMMIMMLPRSVVAARRIRQVLDTEPEITEPAQATQLVDPQGKVEFRNVTFTFPGAEEPVLRNLNFTAEPGKTTAIIGSTGSGKTTLLNLIPRLSDVTEGQVLIDGVPVDDIDPGSLTRTVGMVPQKAFLFSGTVASNLRFAAPDATEEDLWEALRVAQADEFVAARAEGEGEDYISGLDSTISQGGTNVSGGQRQRLCIARALVAEPQIYLFDDSFSALDVTTDADLRAELDVLADQRNATMIIVGQRVSSIMDADQILVLENGQIVGAGTHEELLDSNEVYQEIVDSQISAEEVA